MNEVLFGTIQIGCGGEEGIFDVPVSLKMKLFSYEMFLMELIHYMHFFFFF